MSAWPIVINYTNILNNNHRNYFISRAHELTGDIIIICTEKWMEDVVKQKMNELRWDILVYHYDTGHVKIICSRDVIITCANEWLTVQQRISNGAEIGLMMTPKYDAIYGTMTKNISKFGIAFIHTYHVSGVNLKLIVARNGMEIYDFGFCRCIDGTRRRVVACLSAREEPGMCTNMSTQHECIRKHIGWRITDGQNMIIGTEGDHALNVYRGRVVVALWREYRAEVARIVTNLIALGNFHPDVVTSVAAYLRAMTPRPLVE